jgi:glutathione S-transferase
VLVPGAGRTRHLVWQVTARAQFAVDKAVAIHYEHRRPPELRWPEWEGRLRAQLVTALEMLEEALAGDWFVGGRMTHADIMAAVTVSFVRYTEPAEWPAGRFPKLEALTRRLEQTPEFLAVPIDKE